jgi:hypothetical protein
MSAKYRLPYHTVDACRLGTLARFLLATSSELSAPGGTREKRKVDVLSFDIDANPFCRNPFILISMQNPRGCIPLLFMFFVFRKLRAASPALYGSFDRSRQPHSPHFPIERIHIAKCGIVGIAHVGKLIGGSSRVLDCVTSCMEEISVSLVAAGFPCCVAAKAAHRMPLSNG